MNTPEPFVSVVTPFFNTDQYLSECIESVLNQTYRNFEYLLIDNCSTDRSRGIAEEYARRDSRIRLTFSDCHRSQNANYNYALQHVSKAAQYIKLVQADDWLYPSCITELVSVAVEHRTVAVVSSHDLRGNEVFRSGPPEGQQVLSGRDAARLYFLSWLFPFGSPTTVLYRADVVRARTPFYPDVLHSDTEAVFEILAEHDFGFVHKTLSFTRTRQDSITAKRRDLGDAALDRLIIVKRFGRRFLDDSEYIACLKGAEEWYYRELARRWISDWIHDRNKEFWAFHEDGLNTIGERIVWRRVIAAAGRIFADNLTSPTRLFRIL